MTDSIDFTSAFRALTGHDPFPWQEDLYARLLRDDMPSSLDIPTGLGKTAVIPIWLIALVSRKKEQGEPAVPRRLVYVVNRRTVVDQSTDVVEKMRERLLDPDRTEWAQHKNILGEVRDRLRHLAATDDLPLAISTLRGQFADNREWSADPARPAVILGTVDMIGSRLLFSGYGCSFKTKPLHAGFLGQDVLLVHDEAHLEPAFQQLLTKIEREQTDGRTPDRWPLRIMELTATSRGQKTSGGLTDKEKNPPDDLPAPAKRPIHFVWQRLKATKTLHLHPHEDDKKLAEAIAEFTRNKHQDSGQAILVFARTVNDVDKIVGKLRKTTSHVEPLTGTLRGLERDDLVKTLVFQRFLHRSSRDHNAKIDEETVYLVCTSAGEVGVDISADHMVCDLSTFESMAQRFGRVNRFGDSDDTRIDVFHPTSFDKKGKVNLFDQRRQETLELLERLDSDASPLAPSKLNEREGKACRAAFAPSPEILPATDILFDAWALTTIREKLPGRPPVAPYLHGISEWEPPETHVAWREEVSIITDDDLRGRNKPEDLLEDYPLKPHELLRDRTYRILEKLQRLALSHGSNPVWVVEPDGRVTVSTLSTIADPQATKAKEKTPLERAIAGRTVLLPPSVGGLQDGMLSGIANVTDDVADYWFEDPAKTKQRRIRVWRDDARFDEKTQGMRLIRPIDLPPPGDDEDAKGPSWHWYVRPRSADDDGSQTALEPIGWQHHTDDVTENAKNIVDALNLPKEMKDVVLLAAKCHDLGKQREVWQRSIGNPNPTDWHAKSGKDPVTGKRWWPRDICPDYRHEFGSLLDVFDASRPHHTQFEQLGDDGQDLVLHLIATGHGRPRPHFRPDETFDQENNHQDAAALAVEIPRRFARLQRKYGRWGLAYLESLLRAADYAASAKPSAFVEDQSRATPNRRFASTST